MRISAYECANWITRGLVLAVVSLCAAQAQTPAPQVRTAEQVFKNIQVLKGTPASQLTISMRFLEGSLGVDCGFCHFYEEGAEDFARDGKGPKEAARRMIKMVQDLNKNSFGGGQVVTCYTCHHGSTQPNGEPMLPETLAMAVPRGTVKQVPVLLSTDQIIAKYVQALGGEQAIRKVASRVITATRDFPTGAGGTISVPAQSEQYQKAPNLTVNITHTPTAVLSEGFDGTNAWSQNMLGAVAEVSGPEQERAKRNADLYESVNLKSEYSVMQVRSVEAVNGRSAYLVVGYPPGDSPEWLFFDVTTGLLLRKKTSLPTLFGNMPFEVDYDDYRDTGSGVKIPFWVRMIPSSPQSVFGTWSSIRIQKVQDNVPIDESKFVRPQSKIK